MDTIDNLTTLEDDFNSYTAELKEGQLLGKNKNYRLENLLGVGGMGEVWLATEILGDEEIRKVVVKTLRPDRRGNEGAQEKALEQFRRIQGLNHQNICPIYVIEQDPACGYLIVMGYANGTSYADWFQNQPKQNGGIPLKTVCDVLRPIAEALDYAHVNGVIHRDIKPENMMFTLMSNGTGTSWLIDFGIAANLRTETQATSGQFSQSGTVSYMAPEQISGDFQKAQTDEYSLALVTLEFLTGTTFLQAVQYLPPEIQPVMNKALALNLSDRFTTCREFLDTLEGTFSGMKFPVTSVTMPAPLMMKKSKWTWIFAIIVLLLIASSFYKEINRGGETLVLRKQVTEKEKRIQELEEELSNTQEQNRLNTQKAEDAKTAMFKAQKDTKTANDERDKAIQAQNDAAAKVAKAQSEANTAKNNLAVAVKEKEEAVTNTRNALGEAKKAIDERDKAVQEKKLAEIARRRVERNVQDTEAALSKAREDAKQKELLILPKSPLPGSREIRTVNGVKFAFCWCPPGVFTMGSPENEAGRYDDEKQHKVKLTKGFWLLETEVTQAQWEAIMGTSIEDQAKKMLLDDTKYDTTSGPKTAREIIGFPQDTLPEKILCGKGPDLPMYYVNWVESMEFCRRLSSRLGWQVQLPTEAQWEYACRADSTTTLPNGSMEIKGERNAPALDSIAWYGGNSTQNFTGQSYVVSNEWKETQYPGGLCGVHPVGKKAPNAWGLYDMVGNVNEWCSDWFDHDYCTTAPEYDPENIVPSTYRVFRGGGWSYFARDCRSANRNKGEINRRFNCLGLRVLIVPNEEIVEWNIPKSPQAGDIASVKVDGSEYVFRWCPPGEFWMGSPLDQMNQKDSDLKFRNDEKSHLVKLTQGFWLLETEVTQEMWKKVMGNNPSAFRGNQNPVEEVSWDECQLFCQKLSQKLGLKILLPTEAQWEYACRAGTTGSYAGEPDKMMWYAPNSDSKTHAVAQKEKNAWNLYDMNGNVWEWCSDWYGQKYYNNSPVSDPENTTPSSDRVLRGGCWNDSADHCRSAVRYKNTPGNRDSYSGFRILLVPSFP